MDKIFLDPFDYAKYSKNKLQRNLIAYRVFFVILSLIMFMATLFTGILTPLVISKQVYTSYPTWFFIATSTASAISGLASSLLNFYVVKDSIQKCRKNINLIEKEITLYSNNISKHYKDSKAEYNLYLAVAMINDSHAAKKEKKHG